MRAKEDVTKHTLNLIRGDMEKLQMFYPEAGASLIIRTLVHNHVLDIEAKATPAPSNLQVELSL